MARGPVEMPFLDHLEELRWRLIWSLVALLVACVIGLFAVAELNLIGILERPIRGLLPDQTLKYTSPTTPFFVTLKLGFIAGLVLAVPFLAYQAWAFLSPALYDHERRFVMPTVAAGALLFVLGVAMAYFLVLPFGLKVLLGFHSESLEPIITIDEYLRFATGIILAFGVIFEMPVILVLLSLMGIVTPDGLARYRRHAIVGMAVLSAFLTPADPYTMLAMLVPLVLLYEGSIWIARVLTRRRAARVAGEPGETAGTGLTPPEGSTG